MLDDDATSMTRRMHNSCSSIVLHPCRRVRFFGIGRGGGGVLVEEEALPTTGLDDSAASDELLLPIATASLELLFARRP